MNLVAIYPNVSSISHLYMYIHVHNIYRAFVGNVEEDVVVVEVW